MYSYRIEQAIRAAAILHKDQLRKGSTPLPYITHIMAVAMIVADYTQDEDTVVAAFLHDTLEDTDYAASELQEDFGGKVREIVEELTAPKTDNYNWLQQKKHYAKQLKKGSQSALLIAAADMIHNMRVIVEEYFDDHPRFMADFNGSLDERALMYQDFSNVINSRLKNDIMAEFNLVYTEYKNFILDVKKTKEDSERF